MSTESAARPDDALPLILWAVLSADICVHGRDHLLLTWDWGSQTSHVRLPMAGYLPDFTQPDLTSALALLRSLHDLPATQAGQPATQKGTLQ